MNVTLQYFDGCPNWKVTKEHIDALAGEGLDVTLNLQRVETPESAEELGFPGSPTVIIDGVDPFADSDAPVGLSCRVYRTRDRTAGSPTLAQLRSALRAHEAS